LVTQSSVRRFLSIQEKMANFARCIAEFGYRAPILADLVDGAEFLMVDVGRYLESYQGLDPKVFGTQIKLEAPSIAPSNDGSGRQMVFYRCIMPAWKIECFTDIESFTASGYRRGCYENETRYLIKI
jgi:hypothetical protein